MAAQHWRLMGARSEQEAVGIFTTWVQRRWGSVFWRSWARCLRGRLPYVGQQRARPGRGPEPPRLGPYAAGGAEVYPQVAPGVVHGAWAHAFAGGAP